ncbi:hypothetical protein ABIA35_002325 [Catenulispora sp. MAP12-49]|uniref:hypothetical protein n=1 Tax=Catenulispora sp. MAP12-49 TaxID=3156302 RepID=UPI0035133796
MGQARNWEAIGAVAGIAGVLIALVALVAPNDSSSQAGTAPSTPENTSTVRVSPTFYSPPPVTTAPPSTSPPSSSTSTSTQPPTQPSTQPTTQPPPAPPSSVPAVRPLGCDESFDAINTFDQAWAAATTPGARYIAANNGYKAMSGIVLYADDPPKSQDNVLSGDFVGIVGPLMDDEPVPPAQISRLNADIGGLRAACGAS